MGETQNRPFQLSFNSLLKVDFQGARVTSDGGLILVRELDERLGVSVLIERHLIDSRRGKNVQLPLSDLLRQSVYSRLAGYEDVNDAERLSQDPTFRLIGSKKILERGAALTSRVCGELLILGKSVIRHTQVFDGQRFSSDRPNPAGTGEPRESDQQVGDQNKQQPHREPSFSPLRSFRKSAQQLGLLLELLIRHTQARMAPGWP